jgi:acetate kinase
MKVLVLNSGSSSIKYRVVSTGDGEVSASGIVERIGEEESFLRHRRAGEAEGVLARPVPGHDEGMDLIMSTLAEVGDLHAIGHRVVHGGDRFRDPVLIDDGVVEGIRALVPLAPLHNPGNLMGIESARRIYPSTPQVAVFDTAFHQTLPPKAFHYAIPPEWHDRHKVRRYGFHGTAVGYLVRVAAAHLGKPPGELNLIAFHLGNGSSATAVRGGESVDTSMGMTPLEGLVMGTRSGDVDPGILFYLRRETGMLVDRLETLLNHESGLKGICGSSDMREVLDQVAAGNELARLAVEVYCHRVKKYIGAYGAVLGRVDALVFSGGIGENVPLVRALACEGLERFGIAVDEVRNQAAGDGIREIQPAGGDIRVLVVPAGEELEIARLTVELLGRVPPPGRDGDGGG